ncbi:alpha/beta fold hydrolase [Streptomyces sp. UNOC14_S4]|uniref:alpha/beta fold hydrolase n=1 Tax=Streptomyces sp. UNOC14_S4 TaxID=2872340 RepID=UPI001E420E98|nr:alpha/beta hydrolase [Streptomyces sp. UNOC14_S4]MCC3766843.1 alpha/beta hydrolase [Streptomyces sp. UNOC14_S4]
MELMVPVDGGEVWADDSGGDGPPLVLLHPSVGDSTIWDALVPRLAGHHRVIRHDVRGYGRSPAPTTRFSPVRDLAAVLGHFGVERAALAGSSLGGRTALSFALDAPERVAALALLCPGVHGYPDIMPPGVYAEIGRLAEAGDMDGLVALSLGLWGTAGTAGTGHDGDPEAAAQLRAAIPGWFSTHPYLEPEPPAYGRLGEIRAPSLLVLGERDQPEVVRCNEDIAARIPGCRLVRLPDADHFPTLRAPDRCATLILDACRR